MYSWVIKLFISSCVTECSYFPWLELLFFSCEGFVKRLFINNCACIHISVVVLLVFMVRLFLFGCFVTHFSSHFDLLLMRGSIGGVLCPTFCSSLYVLRQRNRESCMQLCVYIYWFSSQDIYPSFDLNCVLHFVLQRYCWKV